MDNSKPGNEVILIVLKLVKINDCYSISHTKFPNGKLTAIFMDSMSGLEIWLPSMEISMTLAWWSTWRVISPSSSVSLGFLDCPSSPSGSLALFFPLLGPASSAPPWTGWVRVRDRVDWGWMVMVSSTDTLSLYMSCTQYTSFLSSRSFLSDWLAKLKPTSFSPTKEYSSASTYRLGN